GLGGAIQHAVVQVDLDGLGGAGNVGALADDGAAVLDQGLGRGLVDLVLGGAGQRDVAGGLPDAAAVGHISSGGVGLGVLLDAAAADLLQVLDVGQVDAVGVVGRASCRERGEMVVEGG